MKKLLLGVSVVALFMTACNPDQAVVKDLEGTWTLSEVLVDGEPQDLDGLTSTTTFEACKLKSEGPCPATSVSVSSFELLGSTYETTTTSEMTYSVSDKGETLTMTSVSSTSVTTVDGEAQDPVESTCESDCSQTSTILELTDSKAVVEYTEDGVTYQSTMTK